MLDVGYVGSLARHLLWRRNLNSIPFGANFDPRNIDPTTNAPLSPAFLRAYTGYNNVSIAEQASSSNYHSMQVTANRRFARGLEFGVAWTWSKALDYNEGDTDTVSTSGADPRLELRPRDLRPDPHLQDQLPVGRAEAAGAQSNASTTS